jgi:hypothetical protein
MNIHTFGRSETDAVTLPSTGESGRSTPTYSYPNDFIPLDQETRSHVSTTVMCCHLGRQEQTARGWACREDGPLRPIRVNGRLAWPVADIRRILGVATKVEA